MLQQHLADRRLSIPGGDSEDGNAFCILCVGIGTVVKQEFDDVGLLSRGGIE